ncbi:MAG: TlyA family RNA methyltransferase [bacterium]|nr:TlyA family RNA methyltransferase [bacterium]
MKKRRADEHVAAALGVSRTKAQALIMAGSVRVGDAAVRKPGQPVDVAAAVDSDTKNPYVSRAAGKLAAALDSWPVETKERVVLDVGASTGGFTQLALERGARYVVAVDVGTGQLDWKLRKDPRVAVLEETDIRNLEELPVAADLAVVDVSFIGLRSVLPATAGLLPPGAPVVALFKPQFEVGRVEASRGKGVIRNPSAITAALESLTGWLTKHGWTVKETMPSPVKGTKGNQEYLLLLATPPGP